jgi:hypothetical protein
MTTISRNPGAGSLIASHGFDPAIQTLDIELHTNPGIVYRYTGVKDSDYHDFCAAPSLGSHFSRFIKGRYPVEAIETRAMSDSETRAA